MNLTPLDIRRHQFAKALRGYDPAEVDAFLKQISEQNEGVLDQLRQARERVEQVEAKLAHYERVELALQEALESSKDAARRAEETAKERAGLIVEQAELRARSIVQDAERAQYGLRQDIARLSTRQTEVAARLRAFLVSELEVLAQFQGDNPAAPPPPAPGAAPLAAPPALPTGHDWSDVAGPEPEAPTTDADWTAAAVAGPPAQTPTEDPADAPGEADALGGDGTPTETAAATEAMWASEPVWAETDPDDPLLTEEWASADLSADAPADAPPAGVPADGPGAPPVGEAADGGPDEGGAGAPAPAPPAAEGEPGAPPAAGGWDLRSLVTGGEGGASSAAERERIRRILDDLD